TSQGTKNLLRNIQQCEKRRGVAAGSNSSAGAQQTITNAVSAYTPARHRALIAMRCAHSKRPFRSVLDAHYQAEVELLRPGTILPAPSTVSRDVQAIYDKGADAVKAYFLVR
ncbi:hypothetical protein FA95DRAFT_1468683, partial [Auriscalpium vulgare]